jgi:hypothetical protein
MIPCGVLWAVGAVQILVALNQDPVSAIIQHTSRILMDKKPLESCSGLSKLGLVTDT